MKIRICENEGKKVFELPVEADGSLLFSSLIKHFPRARGLRFQTEVETIRGVQLSNGKFLPPNNNWGNNIYYCVYLDDFTLEDLMSTSITYNIKVEDDDEEENTDTEEENYSMNAITHQNTSEVVEAQYDNNNHSTNEKRAINENYVPKPKVSRLRLKNSANKARPYVCDICSYTFTQHSHMQRHRRIHTGERPFGCESCGEKFTRSDKLKLHLRRCPNSTNGMVAPPAIPRKSKIKILSPSSAASATAMVDRTRRKRISARKKLDDTFEWDWDPSVMEDQIRSPSMENELLHDGNGIDELYSLVNLAEVEMDNTSPQQDENGPATKQQQQQVEAIRKGSVASTVDNAYANGNNKDSTSEDEDSEDEVDDEEDESTPIVEAEKNDSNGDFKCTYCDRMFGTLGKFKRHWLTHSKDRPYECSPCSKGFTRVDALKRHLSSASHKNNIQVRLNDTPDSDLKAAETMRTSDMVNGRKRSISSPRVENLVEKMTTGLDQCKVGFDDSGAAADDEYDSMDGSSLAQVTFDNGNEMALINSLTPATASTAPSDPTNVTTSNGEASKYCGICNYNFSNKFNYDRHMKSHNSVGKEYKCVQCSYVFRRLSHLKRHMFLHTGEKPFECELCNEKFSRTDKLKNHKIRVHKMVLVGKILRPPPTSLFSITSALSQAEQLAMNVMMTTSATTNGGTTS